jgi:hypothetical protein
MSLRRTLSRYRRVLPGCDFGSQATHDNPVIWLDFSSRSER